MLPYVIGLVVSSACVKLRQALYTLNAVSDSDIVLIATLLR